MTTNLFKTQTKITSAEADLLLLIANGTGAPTDTWPMEKRRSTALPTLRRKKLVRQVYFPTRYVLTRNGLQIVEQLRAALEHSTTTTAETTP
jgi:hypothetical protein